MPVVVAIRGPLTFVLPRLVATVLLLGLCTRGMEAHAIEDRERVTEFRSDIVLAADGTVTVTETIAVIATGERIARGIHRDFPTLSSDSYGTRRFEPMVVGRVMRDGRPEPFTVEWLAGRQRIRIGAEDVKLEHGRRVFEITYSARRQVTFGREFDEFYWNVTGNSWDLPIEHAAATVRLPVGAAVRQFEVYTGFPGSRAEDARGSVAPDGVLRVETTRRLYIGEGLTVAVGLTKGAVAQPSARQRLAWYVRDNGTTVTALLGLLVVLATGLVAWLRVGRDPARGRAIPQFEPPRGLSPAAVRFVRRMQFDDKTLCVALVSMAVRGYLQIAGAGGHLLIRRHGQTDAKARLSKEEAALAQVLLPRHDSAVVLEPGNHAVLQAATEALSRTLAGQHEETLFVTNRKWFLAGLAIVGLTALAVVVQADRPDDAFETIGMALAWVATVAFVVGRIARRIRRRRSAAVPVMADRGVGDVLFGLLLAVAVPLAMIEVPTLQLLLPAVVLLAAQATVALALGKLLKAPTAEGARVRDEIEGFRSFLSIAERASVRIPTPPQVTPALFERFLPYSIALDVERAWSRRLQDELEAAGLVGTAGPQSPRWYDGNSDDPDERLGAAELSTALGAALTVASSSPASAAKRAGASGGGGGGGGGGGW